jgi:anthranilate synthase component 1
MKIQPDISSFRSAYDVGRAQVAWVVLGADLETPVSAMLKLARDKPNSFLLESVEGGAVRGRYSFIGLNPDLIWRCFGDKAEINRNAAVDLDTFSPSAGSVTNSLRDIVEESRIDLPNGLPPMAAGLVGYMGYDTVRLVEKLPDDNPDTLNTPDGIFIRPTVMAVFDTIEDIVTVITPVRPIDGISSEEAYTSAENRLAAIVADFEASLPHQQLDMSADAPALEPASNMPKEDYYGMIERAKEYILAGDIFQVVLGQRFSVPFDMPALSLYRALRRLNPSPFLFLLKFADFAIVGSSPEILVRVRDNKVTIRPIAGTRPRGKDRAEDIALEEDLLADPKELAEHLMLLDLGRNDVGRVAKVGSVHVTDQMAVEHYSHVMHIVSNVEGDMDPNYDAVSALFAGFPAGTVSGAPKVRAMEIIDELEPVRRGIYAGCIGYFGANGEMDTCITLRTAIIKDGTMYVQAGGGIVADSDPETEYQETRNKSMALIRAAAEAVKYPLG